MPTWGKISEELKKTTAPSGRGPDFDLVRRKYLQAMYVLTGRPVMLYASAWLEPRGLGPDQVQMDLGDMQGIMEAAAGIEKRELDLILHSPGGQPEAAESIVEYLRKRFDHIRVFVPLASMSAGTMVALAADEIVMGEHSQLGPIDPQFIISTPEGVRASPAKAILNQFERAKEECKDPANMAVWMPILRTYAPGLLSQCEDARKWATTMVASWLKKYMLADSEDAEKKASEIAEFFSDYDRFGSHGRRVGIDQAIEQGLRVVPLESDDRLQDAVLSIHHATVHTFSSTGATKLVENHLGKTWARLSLVGRLEPVPAFPANGQPTRAERRRLEKEQAKSGRK